MKNNTILLINAGTDNYPIADGFRKNAKYPPFGLLNIMETLKGHGYKVEIIDLYIHGISRDKFIEKIKGIEDAPILVGISSYTENIHLVEDIINIVRKVYVSSKIVLGGPHISFLPEEGLQKGADYIIISEGESTVIKLLEHLKYGQFYPLKNIDGIAYYECNKLVIRNNNNYIKNLDILPFPNINRLEKYDEMEFLYILTSRGCPGECIFCASRAFSGNKYRMNSAEWIFSYIYYRLSYIKYEYISFIDDTFVTNKKRLKKLFAYFTYNNMKIKWDGRCRLDQLQSGYIKILAENGCYSLHLGIESADQNVLNSIDKNINIDELYDKIPMMIKTGIKPRYSFIIGHYSDTHVSIIKTLILAYVLESNKLGESFMSVSTPFPGTKLFAMADILEINITTKKWKNYNLMKPIYYTSHYSLEDIRRYFYLYNTNKKELMRIKKDDIEIEEFRKYLQDWVSSIK